LEPETRILIVDDDSSGREALELLLRSSGYSLQSAADAATARQLVELTTFQLILCDLNLPDMDGISILRHVRNSSPTTEVIMVTGYASAESAVRAMKEGAFDYITKPINFDELKIVISKAVEKQKLLSENTYLRKQLAERFEFSNIVGVSNAMKNVFAQMTRIAKTDSTVLISGESGTGKELVARALHCNGNRKNKPFIAVNCGAMPEALLESELFGHERGSFTGAHKDKAGKFEAANHGTLFLDEIGTIPLHLQTKLLRALQEQEIERVGSNRSIKLDVRIISATNSNLEQMVQKGSFREDLYYRLNVIPLNLPPLRDRREDIMPLVERFLEKFSKLMGRKKVLINKDALETLEAYKWPGNVRELENMIERMVALTEETIIGLYDIPNHILKTASEASPLNLVLPDTGLDMVLTIQEIERSLIQKAMEQSNGVKARAASLLGINRTTLVEKIKRLKIDSAL